MDEIAMRFRGIVAEHGAEAILPYSYSGTLGLLHNYSMDYRFFYRLGASCSQRTICTAAAVEGHRYTLGNYYGTDPEHFPDAKLIICWGTNPITSNPHLMPFIKAAQDNGAMLVVIDPRRTRTAERRRLAPAAESRLGRRAGAGTDARDHRRGAARRGYVREHTLGFDELRERAAAYPPERVADLTGIPAEEIVRLARLYATTKPAVIRLQYGMQRHSNGGMLVRVGHLPPGGDRLLARPGGRAADELQRRVRLQHARARSAPICSAIANRARST